MQWLVHVKTPVTPQYLTRLHAVIAPFKFGQYIPDNTFVLVCPESVAHALLISSSVVSVVEFHKDFKVDAGLKRLASQPAPLSVLGDVDTRTAAVRFYNQTTLSTEVRSTRLRVQLALDLRQEGPSRHSSHDVAQRWLSPGCPAPLPPRLLPRQLRGCGPCRRRWRKAPVC